MATLKPERDDEAHGRRAVEASLRIELVREAERDVAWVDYSSRDGSQGFEMKRVVPSQFMRLQASVRREPFYPSGVLTKHWTVLVDAPTNDDLLGSPPTFHDPSSEDAADWAKHGFRVASAEERRQEWVTSQSERLRAIPDVRRLGQRIEPHLVVLEEAGIDSTRTGEPTLPHHWSALAAVDHATAGWICEARQPITDAGETAGVELAFGFGYVRMGPNAFVERVINWIGDPDAKWSNVVESTANGGWLRRHGVLLFDPSDPDYWTAEELGERFLPTRPVPLCGPDRLVVRVRQGRASAGPRRCLECARRRGARAGRWLS